MMFYSTTICDDVDFNIGFNMNIYILFNYLLVPNIYIYQLILGKLVIY